MSLRLVLVCLALLVVPPLHGQALIERYQPGTHYFVIDPPQPTTSGDKVEVMEVFSYGCIHCANFETQVSRWKARMPAEAAFVYLPHPGGAAWEMVARAYYAAQALGVLERTHSAFFDAIHLERRPFASLEDVAKWYAEKSGVTQADFLAAARSTSTTLQINRAKQLIPRLGVEGTPVVIVAGKYRITAQSAGGYDRLFDIVDFLVAKELAARAARSG